MWGNYSEIELNLEHIIVNVEAFNERAALKEAEHQSLTSFDNPKWLKCFKVEETFHHRPWDYDKILEENPNL